MLSNILTLGTSFVLSLFLTPLMIMFAKRFKVYDIPGGRKRHDRPTPLLGGLAIYTGAVVSAVLFGVSSHPYAIPVIITGATGVAFMGLIDDLSSLDAKQRLVILFSIALIVFFGCLQYFFTGTDLYLPGDEFTGIMFSAFIIIWIVAVTNAVNFADGLDGLAGCLTLISGIAFAIIFAIDNTASLALTLTLALCGAIAGFIPYNRSPAIVFMGDAGSMFIGFSMSLLSISSIIGESSLLSVIVPVYILFVPILDMLLSMIRRRMQKRSVMDGDHAHFHHKLFEHFHNQITVVVILSLAQTAFAGLGIYFYIYKLYVEGTVILGGVIIASAIYTVLYELKKSGRLHGGVKKHAV